MGSGLPFGGNKNLRTNVRPRISKFTMTFCPMGRNIAAVEDSASQLHQRQYPGIFNYPYHVTGCFKRVSDFVFRFHFITPLAVECNQFERAYGDKPEKRS